MSFQLHLTFSMIVILYVLHPDNFLECSTFLAIWCNFRVPPLPLNKFLENSIIATYADDTKMFREIFNIIHASALQKDLGKFESNCFDQFKHLGMQSSSDRQKEK